MGTQGTLATTVPIVGATQTKLIGLVSAVPLPTALMELLGLRTISDSTPVASPIVRSTVFGFNPTANGDGMLVLNSAGEIVRVTPGVPGKDYAVPPLLSVTDTARPASVSSYQDAALRAWLGVTDFTVVGGGAGYVAPTCAFLGGLPPAAYDSPAQCVRYINVIDGGLGYDPGTTVSLADEKYVTINATGVPIFDAYGRLLAVQVTDMGEGYKRAPQVRLISTPGMKPKRPAKAVAVMAAGRPARATVNIALGAVTGLTITDGGDRYVTPPTVGIYDGAGSGAVVLARMGLSTIDVIRPGKGYTTSAALHVTPLYQAYFSTAADQAGPLSRLLDRAVAFAAVTPVLSAAPVIA
ncbi:MAG: hypothetical protein KGK07_15995 [Chloroflexota bacterium]|nr:hypothetical protein [Chloroflexota bacterium]